MIKELAGMTLEDAVYDIFSANENIQKTGTLSGLMRNVYHAYGAKAPKRVLMAGKTVALNPDDFETDVDGYAALYAILLINTN